jgi:hypothetical protein
MIKSIAYFLSQCAQNSGPVMGAVLDCLQTAGIQTQENSMTSDAAVIWSVLWHGRMQSNQAVYEHYRKQNKPVIIIEVGALYRGQTWKLAVNNITANGHYGHTENLDWDRPRKLGIALAINLSRNPNIVIVAQHKDSLQVADMGSMEDWITNQIKQIREITDRPIVIRPHPRCQLNMLGVNSNVTLDRPQKIKNSYDSYNLAFDCHAIVSYNSGPGIQAALAGTRPIVDQSSLAYPVSIKMQDIDKPYTVDRDRWLVEICHTEYTVNEIATGIWIQRLEPFLV